MIVVREARPQDCGRMSRMLRADHMVGLAKVGVDVHHALRALCDRSYYRKAILAGDDLVALAGCEGSFLDPIGYVWLAASRRAYRYPKGFIRAVQNGLDEILKYKQRVVCSVLDGDEAALRTMAYLGFAPIDAEGQVGLRAFTAKGRHVLVREVQDNSDLRRAVGNYTMVPFAYVPEVPSCLL